MTFIERNRTPVVVLSLTISCAIAWGRYARALDGFRCEHTAQCSAHELCVADTETSTIGSCRRLRVLP
jgi:hypothetical protein